MKNTIFQEKKIQIVQATGEMRPHSLLETREWDRSFHIARLFLLCPVLSITPVGFLGKLFF